MDDFGYSDHGFTLKIKYVRIEIYSLPEDQVVFFDQVTRFQMKTLEFDRSKLVNIQILIQDPGSGKFVQLPNWLQFSPTLLNFTASPLLSEIPPSLITTNFASKAINGNTYSLKYIEAKYKIKLQLQDLINGTDVYFFLHV